MQASWCLASTEFLAQRVLVSDRRRKFRRGSNSSYACYIRIATTAGIPYRDVRRANSRSLSPCARAACLALVGRRRPPGRPHLCPGRSNEPQGLRASPFSRRTRPKTIVQRGPIRNPQFFKDGPTDTAGSSQGGARHATATAPLLCFVSRQRMSRGACPAAAVWHSHGDCIACALARREYGSPIAQPHQQRDTPTAYQNVLPGSLAASCGRSTSCRPELFLGLCGPAKLCNSVHAQRPAGISKGLSLSGPANAAVPSPQVAFFKLSRACLLILLCGKVRTLLQR